MGRRFEIQDVVQDGHHIIKSWLPDQFYYCFIHWSTGAVPEQPEQYVSTPKK